MSTGLQFQGLERDRIHVWTANPDLAGARPDELRALLSADEMERADRFYAPRDRMRFVAARGILRALLGRYLSSAPQSLVFAYNEFGKPSLAFGYDALRFNLSHS